MSSKKYSHFFIDKNCIKRNWLCLNEKQNWKRTANITSLIFMTVSIGCAFISIHIEFKHEICPSAFSSDAVVTWFSLFVFFSFLDAVACVCQKKKKNENKMCMFTEINVEIDGIRKRSETQTSKNKPNDLSGSLVFMVATCLSWSSRPLMKSQMKTQRILHVLICFYSVTMATITTRKNSKNNKNDDDDDNDDDNNNIWWWIKTRAQTHITHAHTHTTNGSHIQSS